MHKKTIKKVLFLSTACLSFLGLAFVAQRIDFTIEPTEEISIGTDPFVCDKSFAEPKQVKKSVAFLSSSESGSGETFDGFFVNGASIRLKENTGLRFRATVPDALADLAEQDGGRFGFAIVPTAYLKKAEELYGKGNYLDSFSALESIGASSALTVYSTPVYGDAVEIYASVVNVLPENLFMPYSAVAFYERSDGTHLYADFSGGADSQSRTVAYVSNASLSDENGGYDGDEYEILNQFVGDGLDFALNVQTAWTEIQIVYTSVPDTTLAVGETFGLETELCVRYSSESGAYGKERVHAPVFYKSENPEIATVDAVGKVTAVSDGDAVIKAVFGDTTSEISIRVQENKQARYEVRAETLYGNPFTNLPFVAYLPMEETFFYQVSCDPDYGELTFLCNGVQVNTSNNTHTLTGEGTNGLFYIEQVSCKVGNLTQTANGISIVNLNACPSKLILPEIFNNKFATKFFGVSSKNLTEISFPSCYNSIGSDGLQGCQSLVKINVHNAKLVKTGKGTKSLWLDDTNLKEIYVSEKTLLQYKADVWFNGTDATLEKIDNGKNTFLLAKAGEVNGVEFFVNGEGELIADIPDGNIYRISMTVNGTTESKEITESGVVVSGSASEIFKAFTRREIVVERV